MGLKFHEDRLVARLAAVAVRGGKLKEEEVAEYFEDGERGYTFECLSTDLHGGWILQHLLTPEVSVWYTLSVQIGKLKKECL